MATVNKSWKGRLLEYPSDRVRNLELFKCISASGKGYLVRNIRTGGQFTAAPDKVFMHWLQVGDKLENLPVSVIKLGDTSNSVSKIEAGTAGDFTVTLNIHSTLPGGTTQNYLEEVPLSELKNCTILED